MRDGLEKEKKIKPGPTQEPQGDWPSPVLQQAIAVAELIGNAVPTRILISYNNGQGNNNVAC
jgi:hypothetical protein